MSKKVSSYYLIFAAVIGILQFFTIAAAQDIEVVLKTERHILAVEGKFPGAFTQANTRNFYFQKAVSGNADLGKRIINVELFGPNGESVQNKQLIPGEYLADSDFRSWKYSIDLTPAANRNATAHASWIGADKGILMLDDLLPHFGKKKAGAKITFHLPEGWKSYSSDTHNADGVLNVADLEKSVIFIGREFRSIKISPELSLLVADKWHFTDEEAAEMVREIFGEYSRMFGPPGGGKFMSAIMRFPATENYGSWEAETRGSTVTIMSSDMTFRTQSLQRLHEQLRHELFHLWFPNSLSLTGDYAWFYEGFALYQSLKLAVMLNRIRFEDFLDTLSRAHTIDGLQRPRVPLIDASSGGGTEVYARGMTVAFLVDLELLQRSKGNRDITLLLKTIFDRHKKPATETNANNALIAALALPEITDRYVKGAEKVDWTKALTAAGIDSRVSGNTTTLTVLPKLDGAQKEILNKLGYNNWRKSGIKR
ncbi:MAG TPA: hypothetical protein VK612_08070 [Pyrinomonadaceae bacterium]|nr:hypothetical protein [Pyrinomonadaceae bacterium]